MANGCQLGPKVPMQILMQIKVFSDSTKYPQGQAVCRQSISLSPNIRLRSGKTRFAPPQSFWACRYCAQTCYSFQICPWLFAQEKIDGWVLLQRSAKGSFQYCGPLKQLRPPVFLLGKPNFCIMQIFSSVKFFLNYKRHLVYSCYTSAAAN